MTAPRPHPRSSPAPALELDLLEGSWLAPLPRALLAGEHLDLLAPLELHSPAADAVPPPPRAGAGRDRLARALEAANHALGHPRAGELAQRLAAPETRVVVTGQQPGLFGGPLYTLSKMAAAVVWAERLERAGQPAVALFWIASEDHDYREVAHARCLTADGAPSSFELPEQGPSLNPVGQRRLGSEVTPLLEQLAQGGGSEPYRQRALAAARCYHPEATFAGAFARYLVELLGERCPLLLDSLDPTLKQLEGPWLERFIERRAEIERALEGAERAVAAAGFELQVRPQPGTSPLFVIEEGERRRVQWEGTDRFSLRGSPRGAAGARPVAELLELARSHPERLSPGVLARPLLQDAVLGTALSVLGPGELSYMSQLAPLYPLLGIDPPRTSLRPQLALLDPRQEAHLRDLAACGIGLKTLLGDEPGLEAALAAGQGCGFASQGEAEVLERIDALRQPCLELEPQLESAWSKTRSQVEKALELLRGKVQAAGARRNEVLDRRARALRQALLPGGVPQERALCCLHFLARFGAGLGQSLLEQLDLDPRVLHLITVEPDHGGERNR